MDRIIGVETEFGTAVWNKNKKEFDKDSMSMQFLVSSLGSANQFLENGARVYLDAGDHIETATPECLSPREAALYDKALEQKIAGIASGFNAGFMSKKKDCKFILFKNNADFSGHSHGCHENYLVPNYLWEAIAMHSTHPVSRFFSAFFSGSPNFVRQRIYFARHAISFFPENRFYSGDYQSVQHRYARDYPSKKRIADA